MTPTQPARESGVAERAREDAERRRREAAERARAASELQERCARDLGDLLGESIDPLSVREHGYERPYYPCTVRALGLTFRGLYLWGGGDWRYHRTSSAWTVTRRRFGFKHTRKVWTIGDLDGWLAR